MSDRKCAGNEGRIHRVKLALYPVGPDPVQVVLDNTAVDQPPSVEHHAGSKQLDGLTDFRWLGKTVQLTEQRDRIQKTMTMGHTLNQGSQVIQLIRLPPVPLVRFQLCNGPGPGARDD